MGTPHYIYSTAHEPHDAALDESLLDDMGPDEVEDDDTPAASEEDFDTEVWIHSVDNFASGYIGRVIHSLTDRFLIDKETKEHHLCVHVNAGDICAERMCDFIVAAFCAAGGRKTRVGLTGKFGFTVEMKNSGIWIQSTMSAVESLFGRFSGSGVNAKGIFSAISKAAVRNSRQYSALADRLGDDFYVRWIIGKGYQRTFTVSASGTVTEIKPYYYISKFYDGIAMVKDDGVEWNLIRLDGTEVCSQWFYNGTQVYMSGSWPIPCHVSRSSLEWNFVNKDGSFLLKKNMTGVSAVGCFSEGYAWVKRKDRECNFIDMDGRLVMRRWGWYLGPVENGFARIYKNELRNGTVVANYVRVPQGTLLLDKWHYMVSGFSGGVGVVSETTNRNSLSPMDKMDNAVGTDGRLLFKKWFRYIFEPRCGMVLLKDYDQTYMVADTAGNFLTEHPYPQVSIFNERFVQLCKSKNFVKKNMTVLKVDTGTVLCCGEIVADYDAVGMVCVVMPSGRWSLVAYDGKFVIDEMFGAEFSVPVLKDGFFMTTDGARCIRFGADGSHVSCV